MSKEINKYYSENGYLREHVDLLLSSYQHWVGKNVIETSPSDEDIYNKLFMAPYGVVSNGTEHNPIFNYANQMALNLFEMNWGEFIKLPSRQSAEAVNREEREQLLARVTKYGFIDDYRGIRISSSGKRFMIEDATVWNIVDNKGIYYGQAAMFHQWRIL